MGASGRSTARLRESHGGGCRDIFAIGSILSILISLRGDSLVDTGPLAALIARHVDADLGRFAGAHNRGRRLHRHRRPRFHCRM